MRSPHTGHGPDRSCCRLRPGPGREPAMVRKCALVTDGWPKSVVTELADECGHSQLSDEWRGDGDAKSLVLDSSEADDVADKHNEDIKTSLGGGQCQTSLYNSHSQTYRQQ